MPMHRQDRLQVFYAETGKHYNLFNLFVQVTILVT